MTSPSLLQGIEYSFNNIAGNRGLVLELTERLDIAIDIAHAITYLHSYNGK